MTRFLKALRRGQAGHREVFAEFVILLVFAVAEQRGRGRVVR
jgi:hypothetical protein